MSSWNWISGTVGHFLCPKLATLGAGVVPSSGRCLPHIASIDPLHNATEFHREPIYFAANWQRWRRCVMPSNGQFLHQTGSINPFPNTTEFQEEYSYHFPTHRPPPRCILATLEQPPVRAWRHLTVDNAISAQNTIENLKRNKPRIAAADNYRKIGNAGAEPPWAWRHLTGVADVVIAGRQRRQSANRRL